VDGWWCVMCSGDMVASPGTLRPDVDDAFWTIVTGDDQWLRAEFEEIIDAGWDTPAPPPPPAPAHLPEPGAPIARTRHFAGRLHESIIVRSRPADQRAPPRPAAGPMLVRLPGAMLVPGRPSAPGSQP